LLIAAAGQKQDGLGHAFDFPNVLEHLDAAHFRYAPIQHKQIEGVAANGFDHGSAVWEHRDRVAGGFQDVADVLSQMGFVFK
jgi:hypothetical protein